MVYRREIDGLRALAVIPVILFHAGFELFSGGFAGVDVFFVISGYLIASIVMSEMAVGHFSIARFYERRARRILPALLLVVAVCVPVAYALLLPSDLKEFGQSLIATMTFSSNILFWSQAGYFEGAAELKPLLHTWSLAVEEQFYLFFPLFMMLSWRWGRSRMVAVLGFLALGSLMLAQWGALNKPIAAFFLLPTRTWELIVGVLVAFYMMRSTATDQISLVWRNVASMLGLTLLLVAIFGFDRRTPFPGLYALLPTVGTALLIVYCTPQTLAGKALGSRVMVGVGLISYSAYLWHQPLFAFAKHAGLHGHYPFQYGGLSVLALIFAYVSWRFVELPFRQRQWFSRRQVTNYGLTGCMVVTALGVVAHTSNGFIDHLKPEDRYLASISPVRQGEYVRKRFDSLQHASFSKEDKRLKVLVIGDSFAKDLVNAIYEGPLASRMQVSTHQISAGCGNLYLPSSIESQITNPQPASCLRDNWYNSPEVKELISQSDRVWVASAWQKWEVKWLSESFNNLRREYGDKFLIFGVKNFGSIDIKKYLTLPSPSRHQVRNRISDSTGDINGAILEVVGASNFVNLSDLMCGRSGYCSVFRLDGRLLSYDGAHLTVDGAQELSSKLLASPVIFDALSR